MSPIARRIDDTGALVCLHCQQPFEPVARRQSYCLPCRKAALAQNRLPNPADGPFPTRECKSCGKSFVPRLENPGQHCDRCKYVMRCEELACQICGKAFRSALIGTRTCSSACKSKLMRKDDLSVPQITRVVQRYDDERLEGMVQLTDQRRRLSLDEARSLAAKRCPACRGKLILERDLSAINAHDLQCVACSRIYGQVILSPGRQAQRLPSLGSAPGRRRSTVS